MAGTITTNTCKTFKNALSLNGVRPRWPEQSGTRSGEDITGSEVSMESGLDGRNNRVARQSAGPFRPCLNGVRPRWPEQSWTQCLANPVYSGLNGVRPRWPEQSNRHEHPRAGSPCCLNGVRPRWPEQSVRMLWVYNTYFAVSMESGLDGRNNLDFAELVTDIEHTASQWSPA